MQEKRLLKIQVIVAIICIILGTILHFLYKWTGENKVVASFSAINESVWEHLKLAFYPMLMLGIGEYFLTKNISNNYIEAKTIGIFIAISFIVIFFYTYTGILGKNFLFIDILSFIFSIMLGEWIAYEIMIMPNGSSMQTKILSAGIVIFLLISFIVVTYFPPKINLFKDPVDKTYGLK